ncbi:MAG TPA: HAD family phosphatase [Candidatus Paceibacterota bacterium]
MIKAVIFDLNGIFIQAPKLGERLTRDYGVDHAKFMPKLHEIMHQIRQPGAKSAFTYWGEALKDWGVSFTESDFWKYWFGAEVVSEKMVAFAKNLRTRGVKVFILSNNFKERSQYYDQYPWVHEAVDKVYFSWQTGYVKPDVRAWQNVLKENNLKPEDCIYFDDQERNLKASAEVGIKAYHFTNEEELERIVNNHL